jgi:hypothetical protein
MNLPSTAARPFLLAGLALAIAAPAARADGLSDLRAALGRLGGTTPLKATLEIATLDRHGEGKEARDKPGQAGARIEDGPRGLQIAIAPETLARLDAESRALGRDPEAKTPATLALKGLAPTDVRPLTAAATALARLLDESAFKGERVQPWQGRPARVVSFSIPIDKLTAEQRKYVRKFEGTLDVWIAPDGTPLASGTHIAASGRAMLVISFEAHDDAERTYAVVGDRLVTVREETSSASSGAGEHGERQAVRTLTLE